MSGLTQPLNFRKAMGSRPMPGFDFVPFLDAILIALFVALNVSTFVFSPGTSIRLPSSPELLATRADPAAVLTVDQNQLFFFKGLKLARNKLEDHLVAFMDDYVQRTGNRQATLLIKADASIQTEELFQLMDIAQRAGFTEVHLAAEPRSADWDELWDSGAESPSP